MRRQSHARRGEVWNDETLARGKQQEKYADLEQAATLKPQSLGRSYVAPFRIVLRRLSRKRRDRCKNEWPADAGHSVLKNRRGRLTPFRFGEPQGRETAKTCVADPSRSILSTAWR